MATFRFVVRKERDNALMLRITANRKSAELALGVSVEPEMLEQVVEGTASLKYIKAKSLVATCRVTASRVMRELEGSGRTATATELRDRIRRIVSELNDPRCRTSRKGGFLAFAEKVMSRAEREATRMKYKYSLMKMRRFCESRDYEYGVGMEELEFEHITVQWLGDFDFWMKGSGLAANTRWGYLKNIKAIFNKAIDEELTNCYPFRRFKIKQVETKKRSLEVEKLRAFFNVSCTEAMQFYVDMFKLSFLLIGINPVDMYGLTEIRNGRVEYIRSKTGKEYSIKVEPEAMELIKKWSGRKNLLCLADRWTEGHSRFVINSSVRLKYIAKKNDLRMPDISMYWARHSWATIAYELDIPIDTVAQALGHSNGHETTNIYIKRKLRKVDEANRRVLDYVLYGEGGPEESED